MSLPKKLQFAIKIVSICDLSMCLLYSMTRRSMNPLKILLNKIKCLLLPLHDSILFFSIFEH